MKTKKLETKKHTRADEMKALEAAIVATAAEMTRVALVLQQMIEKQGARWRELGRQEVRMNECDPLKEEIKTLKAHLNPPVEKPAPAPVKRPGSGPQFDPAMLATVRNLPEPFTRESIAVALGVSKEAATQRIIRMNNQGWLMQPARGLWKRSATFGVRR